MIRKHGEKLRQLIIDLNLTSKPEYAMQPLQKALVSPVELSRQVVESLSRLDKLRAFMAWEPEDGQAPGGDG